MRNEQNINRIVFVIIMTLLIAVILCLRIIQFQIFERGKYLKRAEDQYQSIVELPGERGIIYDRNFQYLAINKPVVSCGIDINKVKNTKTTAAKIAEVLVGSKEQYQKKLTSGAKFVWLKRSGDQETYDKLHAKKIDGLREIPESIRFYPEKMLIPHLVGYTDVDLKGISGVELYKDRILRGKAGRAYYIRGASRNIINADLTTPIDRPESGNHVVLTIDNSFQRFAMEELNYIVRQYQAESGMVIITNPMTGEILANAVMPTFDPNDPGRYSTASWRNRIITDSFEPGSTFKPIFLSAILEEGLKTPEDAIFCENGKYRIYDQLIEDVHGYGTLTVQKIISKSSNIGMVKMAKETPKDLIYQNARKFGFGVKTGIELEGEVSGTLKNTIEWSRYTPIALSIGYEVSVSPAQMAMAYGAIANGGRLLKPQIYYGEFKVDKSEIRQNEPIVIREVLAEKTCRTLCSMLEEVVTEGTGQKAAIPGVRIAGKTGTSRRFDIERKQYSKDEFYSSFIGFFPVDDPQILIYVLIDNPKGEYLGGVVAATTFNRIAKKIVHKMDIDSRGVNEDQILIEKKSKKDDEIIVVPNLVSKKLAVGVKIIEDLNLKAKIQGDGDLIYQQSPTPGTRVTRKSPVMLTTADFDEGDKLHTIVPRVIGMTIRDALNRLSRENLQVVVQGSGRVIHQKPEPGSRIRIGAQCVIECEPLVDLADFTSW